MLIVTRKPGEKIVIVDGSAKAVLTMLRCRSANGSQQGSARMSVSGHVEDSTVNVFVGGSWWLWGDVVAHVQAVSRGQAQIGVEAPRHITIDREEVYLKKQEAAGHA